MNKQEQIEEMAVIGCVRNPQAHTAEECAKCDFKQGQCNAYRHAEKLYNAGYRKVDRLEKQLSDKYVEIDNLNRDYRNAFERLKSQQQEIDKYKAEIEQLKTDDAKLQERFAQYQMASDKEIRAQVRQAKIDVLNVLRLRIDLLDIRKQSFFADGWFKIDDMYKEIDELLREV